MKELEINSIWLVKFETGNDATLAMSLWNRKFNVEIGRKSIAFGETPGNFTTEFVDGKLKLFGRKQRAIIPLKLPPDGLAECVGQGKSATFTEPSSPAKRTRQKTNSMEVNQDLNAALFDRLLAAHSEKEFRKFLSEFDENSFDAKKIAKFQRLKIIDWLRNCEKISVEFVQFLLTSGLLNCSISDEFLEFCVETESLDLILEAEKKLQPLSEKSLISALIFALSKKKSKKCTELIDEILGSNFTDFQMKFELRRISQEHQLILLNTLYAEISEWKWDEKICLQYMKWVQLLVDVNAVEFSADPPEIFSKFQELFEQMAKDRKKIVEIKEILAECDWFANSGTGNAPKTDYSIEIWVVDPK